MSTSSNGIVFLGIDDGNAQHKVISGNISTVFPTHIERDNKRFVDTDMDLVKPNGMQEISSYTSVKSGTSYLIGDVREPIPRNKTFAYEEPGQILFQHALSLVDGESSLEHNKFVACAGMPLRLFYKQDGSLNADNVKKKMVSMAQSFELFGNDESVKRREKNCVQLIVQPEALSALRTYLFVKRPDGKIVPNPEYQDKTIAVVDPGGKTTDIAVFTDGKIDMDRSITVNIGYNDLIRKATSYLFDLGFPSPTHQQAKTLIDGGMITIKGNDEDHSAWAQQAKTALASDIFSKVTDTLSDAIDIDLMIFIGGTVSALKNEITPLIDAYYGDGSDGDSINYVIPENADLLNAKGFELSAQLWYQTNKAS